LLPCVGSLTEHSEALRLHLVSTASSSSLLLLLLLLVMMMMMMLVAATVDVDGLDMEEGRKRNDKNGTINQ